MTAEEFQQLKENIFRDGCRDALVTWNSTIIDGHNRYKICDENDIPFKITAKNFDDRSEAIEWIIRNQFGRRNLQVYAKAELVFRLEDIIRVRAKEKMTSTLKQNTANLNSEKRETINTDKELAKIAGVSADSIWKSRVIKNEGDEDLKNRVRKGELSLNKAFNEVRKPVQDGTDAPETKTKLLYGENRWVRTRI